MIDFDKIYNRFKDLSLHKHANEDTFEKFTKYICNKEVISCVNDLLKFMDINYKKVDINAKELISSYTIAAYDNIVLNSERTYNDLRIYNLAQTIVDSLENKISDNNQIDGFIEDANNYKNIFDEWKNDDKQIIIDSLVRSYHELEMSAQNVDTSGADYEEFHEHIGMLKDQILGDLKKIGGDEAIEEIKNYQPYSVMFDEKTVGGIKSMIKMAFWDKFKTDLKSNPPDLKMVPGLITDIKNFFLKITNKNKTLNSYFDSRIDIQNYQDKVNTNNLGLQDMYNFFIFCFGKIKELGPPVRDKKIDEKIESIHDKMKDISKLDLTSFIVNEFKDIINNLELILDETDLILNSSNNNHDKNTADKNTTTEE